MTVAKGQIQEVGLAVWALAWDHPVATLTHMLRTVQNWATYIAPLCSILWGVKLNPCSCQSLRSLPWPLSVHEWPTAWSIFMGFQEYTLQNILLIFVFLPLEAHGLCSPPPLYPDQQYAAFLLCSIRYLVTCIYRMPALQGRLNAHIYPNLKSSLDNPLIVLHLIGQTWMEERWRLQAP